MAVSEERELCGSPPRSKSPRYVSKCSWAFAEDPLERGQRAQLSELRIGTDRLPEIGSEFQQTDNRVDGGHGIPNSPIGEREVVVSPGGVRVNLCSTLHHLNRFLCPTQFEQRVAFQVVRHAICGIEGQ